MKNYILRNENAIYYECGFSCDNVIFISLGSEKFFLTDARYVLEAKEYAYNCTVVESRDLFQTAKVLLKDSKIKKLTFDPNDFTYFAYSELVQDLDIEFIQEANFSKLKRIIKTDDEIAILSKAAKLGREGFKTLAKYIRKNAYNQKEEFLNFKAIEKMSQQGKYNLSFEPILAINENAAKPHALPTKKRIKTT